MNRESFFRDLKKLEYAHRLSRRAPFATAALRLASFGAYRGLELLLGRAHPHVKVVEQARALNRTAAPVVAPGARKRVLFFTLRGWYIHAGTEAILAKALQQRGAEVSFFLCGGGLRQCDFKPPTDAHVTAPLCWRCRGFAQRLLEAFQLPCRWLEQVVGEESFERARRRVGGLDKQQLRALEYEGLPVGEYVGPSVHRALLRGDIDDSPESLEILRGYVESAIIYVDACARLLELERPDAVVMTNGLFFCERVMLEQARRRGLHVVTYERGMQLQSLLLTGDRPTVPFDLDELWERARHLPLTADEERALDATLAARAGGVVGAVDLWPRMENDARALLARLGLQPGRPLAVAFPNILWDSAVYRQDRAFHGMFDWIAQLVRAFQELPEADLVIRVSPSEVRLPLLETRDRVIDRLRQAFPALPPNVHLIPPEDPASSYALISQARAALVYTSTIGLEAAVRGKPVLVAGRTHYRGKGFTVDLEDREAILPRVREHLGSGRQLAPEQLERARRYAHLFFNRFHLRFPWIVDHPRSARTLTFSELEALAPGRDEVLDRICEGILEARPFVELPGASG